MGLVVKFKPGDLVYFNEAKSGPSKKLEGFKMNYGYAYGILLGFTKPFGPTPDPDVLFRVCASFGMVTIDSIFEHLGEDQLKIYLEKQATKQKLQDQEWLKKMAPKSLVGPDGKEIEVRDEGFNDRGGEEPAPAQESSSERCTLGGEARSEDRGQRGGAVLGVIQGDGAGDGSGMA